MTEKEPTTGVAVRQAPPAMVLRPSTFEELLRFASMAAKTSMVPRDYMGKPENIMLAVQMGSELGLAPMQSLQNIACVNGRPAVWGDALPGLCRQSPVCDDIRETIAGEGDAMVATCTALRVGKAPVVRAFGVEDAKKAGLWGKQGPWQQYPKRMLQMRARGFALRDAFPDVLRGLITVEEASDTTVDDFRGVTIEAAHAPAAEPEVGVEAAAAPPPTRDDRRHRIVMWLDGLEIELRDAAGVDAVDAILARDDVQRAQDVFRGADAQRLGSMIHAATRVNKEVGDGQDNQGH